MTDLATDIAQHIGARLSESALTLLYDVLLPQEPVLSAVAGAAGGAGSDRLYLLLTPLRIAVVRDGRREQRVTPVQLSDWTGWEITPGWFTGFHLATHHGIVDVAQVDATQARQFAYALDQQASLLGAFGAPAGIERILAAFEDLAGGVWSARRSGPAGELAAGKDAAVACLDLLVPIVRSRGALTMGMAFALNGWLGMSDPARAVGRGGGAAVRELLAESRSRVLVEKMALFTDGEPDDQARVMSAMQEVVVAFAATIPAGADAETAPYTRLAQRLHELAAALTGPAVPAPPAGVDAGESDLLSQLERLAQLRASGAITDDEFADLKSKLLTATP